MLIRIKLINGLMIGVRYVSAQCGCSGIIVMIACIEIDFGLTICPDDELVEPIE